MKQVCCKNSKNYCHPKTHNHIHSTEKSGLKNKTCISLWPFGSGICLTIQAKCLIAPHLPLSYFPPHLFVFHHSLLHCPLANCRLFKLNLYQVILRFAALFTRWFAMSWQKFQGLYCFKVTETLTTELMSAFDVRRNCRDIYLFIKDCLICIFFIVQYQRYILMTLTWISFVANKMLQMNIISPLFSRWWKNNIVRKHVTKNQQD